MFQPVLGLGLVLLGAMIIFFPKDLGEVSLTKKKILKLVVIIAGLLIVFLGLYIMVFHPIPV